MLFLARGSQFTNVGKMGEYIFKQISAPCCRLVHFDEPWCRLVPFGQLSANWCSLVSIGDLFVQIGASWVQVGAD